MSKFIVRCDLGDPQNTSHRSTGPAQTAEPLQSPWNFLRYFPIKSLIALETDFMWGSLPSSYSPWAAALSDPIICLNKPFLRSETGLGVRCYVSMPSISLAEGTHQHPPSCFSKAFLYQRPGRLNYCVQGLRGSQHSKSVCLRADMNTLWLTFFGQMFSELICLKKVT